MAHLPVSDEREVIIDPKFVREQANSAVRQFFAPITAPFRIASQTFATQAQAVKSARDVAKRRPR